MRSPTFIILLLAPLLLTNKYNISGMKKIGVRKKVCKRSIRGREKEICYVNWFGWLRKHLITSKV